MTGGVQSRLSTCVCFGCESECHHSEMHSEHIDLCSACGDSLAAELATERALDFRALSKEALVDRVVDSAKARAKTLYSARYSISEAG